jgi:hypothetical protein
MKLNAISKLMLTAFATVALAIPAMAGEVKMSGNVEINIDYKTDVVDYDEDMIDLDNVEKTYYDHGGRAELVAEGSTKAGDLVASGKGCMELKVDGTVGVCDVWVKVGTSNVDVQVGRFEKIGVYSKGLDIYLLEAPGTTVDDDDGEDIELPMYGIYEANYVRGRGPGDLALHFNGENFTLELGATYGSQNNENYIGFRPAADVTFGPINLVAAFESLTIKPQDNDAEGQTTKTGAGIKVKYTTDMLEVGVNLTNGNEGGEVDDDNDKDEVTRTTMGLYGTFKFDGKEAGAGFHTTKGVNDMEATLGEDSEDYETTSNTFFVSYAHPLPVEGAAIKLGLSTANGEAEYDGDGVYTSSANGMRVRFWYEF